MDILGLGMSLLDTLQLVDDFPAGSGVTEVRDSALMGGGPVPTALCAAARLGAKTAILDRVGDDWRGDLIAADYARFGVDFSMLIREPGRTSSLGIVLVRKHDGERHVVFQCGDATPLRFEDLPQAALRSCRILHLNGRHWPACLEAAQVVRDSGGLVSFDGGANRYDPKFSAIFPFVDLFIVARDFAEKFAGSEDRAVQLDALAKNGTRLVGITDGVHGSWFSAAGGETFHEAAFEVDRVVDTTGCGDVFHGAFLAAVAAGGDWRECARLASAAAALNATALGGRGKLPRLDEVQQFLKR